MRDFNEHTATAAVLERMAGCSDERLKEIMTSVVTHLHAVVREVEPTKPIGGALLDVWQTSSDGAYDVQDPTQPEMNLRGLFTTGADGRFWFRTVKPKHYSIPTDGPVGKMLMALGRHPMRPAHIHFIIGAPGFEPVTTHMFVAGDDYLDSDAVFGVKDSLIADFARHDDPPPANPLRPGP